MIEILGCIGKSMKMTKRHMKMIDNRITMLSVALAAYIVINEYKRRELEERVNQLQEELCVMKGD